MSRKKEYSEYLHSEGWIKTRDRVRQERKVCEVCGSDEELQVHHLTYENIGNEKDEDLILLCKDCHYAVHKGVYLVIPNMNIEKFDDNILKGLQYTKISRIYFQKDRVLIARNVVIENAETGKQEIYADWQRLKMSVDKDNV